MTARITFALPQDLKDFYDSIPVNVSDLCRQHLEEYKEMYKIMLRNGTPPDTGLID